jgi:hypothetical protein
MFVSPHDDEPMVIAGGGGLQEVGGGCVESGNWYAHFFRNLPVWTGQL